jgi:hypothetical protein
VIRTPTRTKQRFAARHIRHPSARIARPWGPRGLCSTVNVRCDNWGTALVESRSVVGPRRVPNSRGRPVHVPSSEETSDRYQVVGFRPVLSNS